MQETCIKATPNTHFDLFFGVYIIFIGDMNLVIWIKQIVRKTNIRRQNEISLSCLMPQSFTKLYFNQIYTVLVTNKRKNLWRIIRVWNGLISTRKSHIYVCWVCIFGWQTWRSINFIHLRVGIATGAADQMDTWCFHKATLDLAVSSAVRRLRARLIIFSLFSNPEWLLKVWSSRRTQCPCQS